MATGLQNYLTPLQSFGGDEWLNRQKWASMPKSGDMRLLDQTYQRSKAAHDLLMNAQAMEAEQDNAILQTATPDELANLFGPPRTPREQRLQRIVQRDVNAKEMGASMIPNELQALDYNQRVANLGRTNLQNYLDPLRFGLDEARFGETVNQNYFNRANQQAQREHAVNQLSSQNQFRNIQAQNAEANRLLRERMGQATLGQRERFHGDTQANQGLAQMMQMERMLQDQAEAEQRQRNFESTFNRGYFQDVATAANAGALPPNQLGQFSSRFDPATMAILQGYANLGQQQGFGGTQPSPSSNSPGYLQMLNQFFNPLAPFMNGPSAAAEPDWTSDGADEGEGDFGMGNDFATPPAMAARPAAPAPQSTPRVQIVPQNLRGNYVEGRAYPARDGSTWQYTNGQMVRIR